MKKLKEAGFSRHETILRYLKELRARGLNPGGVAKLNSHSNCNTKSNTSVSCNPVNSTRPIVRNILYSYIPRTDNVRWLLFDWQQT